MFEDETPVAWTVMPREAPVVAADGTEIGKAEQVLGDVEEDIFHGIVLKRSHDGELFELPAVHIKRITERHVITDLSTGDVPSLSRYRRR
jgi:rRNA processing protein Gar1